MTDCSDGDPCPACLAERDQEHATLVRVRDICIAWGELGHLAQVARNTKAAISAQAHLLNAFRSLGAEQQLILVNYMFTNTVTLGVEMIGGLDRWRTDMDPVRLAWLDAFVASDGVQCGCSVPHDPVNGDATFYPANLIQVDGEPV